MAYPVLHVIERIVAPPGLRVDATSPWVNRRLPDGSRVQTKSLKNTPLSWPLTLPIGDWLARAQSTNR
jgi:Flp pilus assembly CpaF family ATPase